MRQTHALVLGHLHFTAITLPVLIASTTTFVTSTENTSVVQATALALDRQTITATTTFVLVTPISVAATCTKRTSDVGARVGLLLVSNHPTATVTLRTVRIIHTTALPACTSIAPLETALQEVD